VNSLYTRWTLNKRKKYLLNHSDLGVVITNRWQTQTPALNGHFNKRSRTTQLLWSAISDPSLQKHYLKEKRRHIPSPAEHVTNAGSSLVFFTSSSFALVRTYLDPLLCFRGALSKHTLLCGSQCIMAITQTYRQLKRQHFERHILNKLNFNIRVWINFEHCLLHSQYCFTRHILIFCSSK